MKNLLLLLLVVFGTEHAHAQTSKTTKGIFLENIPWTTAKELLTPDAVVVIPLGAGAKEHGPHLPLATDYLQAESTAKLVAQERNVVITPVVNYGFYPAFLRYAGSTSLDFVTATDMMVNIVRSLAAYGPKRFYVINMGMSTTPSLGAAAKLLADEGILLYYSDFERANIASLDKSIKTQDFGTHADEMETSTLLYLHPELVDMNKAVNDTTSKGMEGMILSPVNTEYVLYCPSGIVGYAALATKDKGMRFVSGFIHEVVLEIDSIATCALPKVIDRTEEYKAYEGEYSSADAGRKNLIIQIKDNQLWFKPAGAPFFMPFPLYRNAVDYFSSQILSILFIKNEAGQVEKAWIRSFRGGGGSLWVTKVK